MAKAGIREIREHLTRYLRRVTKRQEEIVITDRDRPVAKLVPLAGIAARLQSRRALRDSIKPRGLPLSQHVIAQRDEERF